jgi:hypothetical protein
MNAEHKNRLCNPGVTTDLIPQGEEKAINTDLEFYRRISPPVPTEELTWAIPEQSFALDANVMKALQEPRRPETRIKDCLLSTVVGTLFGTMRMFYRGDYSRTIRLHGGWNCDAMPTQHVRQEAKEYPLATFYAPLEFNWTETEYEADQAIREYLKENHADR